MKKIIFGVVDPSSAGVAAPIGSLYFNSATVTAYMKTGAGDADWELFADAASASGVTVQEDGTPVVTDASALNFASASLHPLGLEATDETGGVAGLRVSVGMAGQSNSSGSPAVDVDLTKWLVLLTNSSASETVADFALPTPTEDSEITLVQASAGLRYVRISVPDIVSGTSTFTSTGQGDSIRFASRSGVWYLESYNGFGVTEIYTDGTTATGVGTLASPVGAAGVLMMRQVFTASGTYTPTTGATKAVVRMVGGGGAGGSCSGDGSGNWCAAGGGGSGASWEKYIDAGAQLTGGAVTIGAAGAAAAAGANNGGTGGDTSVVIQGTTYTAKGGTGGGGGAIASVDIAVGGIAPNTSSAADFVVRNAGGTVPTQRASGGATGGSGGSSLFGGGGAGAVLPQSGGAFQPPFAGTGYGAGGGGAVSKASNTAGAAGTAGLIVIDEYS